MAAAGRAQRSQLVVGTDIAGAFDSVDHSTLIERVRSLPLEKAAVRFVFHWLRRDYRVRVGSSLSLEYRTHRGVPQGGVLSPVLWNVMVRGVPEAVEAELPGVHLRFYADDGTIHIVRDSAQEVVATCHLVMQRLNALLGARRLRLEPSKCEALWVRPGVSPESRPDDLPHPTSKGVPVDPLPPGLDVGVPQVPLLRVLGVHIDARMSFVEHLDMTIAKCQRRLAVLRKLASTGWGLDVPLLSFSAAALLHHVACYGIVAVGPYVEQEATRRYDVRVGHPAARTVLGVSRSSRREALYLLSGLSSYHNLYQQRAATFLDRVHRGPRTRFKASLPVPAAGADNGVAGTLLEPRPEMFAGAAATAAREAVCEAVGRVDDQLYMRQVLDGEIYCFRAQDATAAPGPAQGGSGAGAQPAPGGTPIQARAEAGRYLAHTIAPEVPAGRRRHLPRTWRATAEEVLSAARISVGRLEPQVPYQPATVPNNVEYLPDAEGLLDLEWPTHVLATDGAFDLRTGDGAYAALLLDQVSLEHPSRLDVVAVAGVTSSYEMEVAGVARGLRLAIRKRPPELEGTRLLLLTDCRGVITMLERIHGGATDTSASEAALAGLLRSAAQSYAEIRAQHVHGHSCHCLNDIADLAAGALMRPEVRSGVGRWGRLHSLGGVKRAVKETLAASEADILDDLRADADSVSGDIISALALDRYKIRRLYRAIEAVDVANRRPIQVLATKVLTGSRFKRLTGQGLAPQRCYCGELDSLAHFFGKYCADFSTLRRPTSLARLFASVFLTESFEQQRFFRGA
eukprot:g16595.t1